MYFYFLEKKDVNINKLTIPHDINAQKQKKILKCTLRKKKKKTLHRLEKQRQHNAT